MDVANYDEIVALKEKIKIDLGDVDILVNNAGLLPKISLLQGEPSDLKRIINVNLVAHFWVRNDCERFNLYKLQNNPFEFLWFRRRFAYFCRT